MLTTDHAGELSPTIRSSPTAGGMQHGPFGHPLLEHGLRSFAVARPFLRSGTAGVLCAAQRPSFSPFSKKRLLEKPHAGHADTPVTRSTPHARRMIFLRPKFFLPPSSSPVVPLQWPPDRHKWISREACFFPVPPLVLGPQRAHGHVGAWRCACPRKMSGHDLSPHLCRATCESGLIGMIPATFLLSRLTIDCLLALQG